MRPDTLYSSLDSLPSTSFRVADERVPAALLPHTLYNLPRNPDVLGVYLTQQEDIRIVVVPYGGQSALGVGVVARGIHHVLRTHAHTDSVVEGVNPFPDRFTGVRHHARDLKVVSK